MVFRCDDLFVDEQQTEGVFTAMACDGTSGAYLEDLIKADEGCNLFANGIEGFLRDAGMGEEKALGNNGLGIAQSVRHILLKAAVIGTAELSSKDDWNENKDESSILAGAQFKVGKYVKLAPNFRMFMPKKEGADNRYMAYISCYFGI